MRLSLLVLAALLVAGVGLVPAQVRAQPAQTLLPQTVLPVPPPPEPPPRPQVPTLDPPPDLAGLENRPVTRVAVVLEGNVWDDVEVPVVTRLKPGDLLTPAGTRAVLRELLRSGRFARGRVLAQQDGGGALVTARLVPRKLIDRLQLELHGAHLEVEELLRSADLAEGGEIVGADLDAKIASLERTFALHGYPAARARIQMRDTDDSTRTLVLVDVAPGAPRFIGDRRFYVFGASPEAVAPITSSYGVNVKDRTDEPMLDQADGALEEALRAKG